MGNIRDGSFEEIRRSSAAEVEPGGGRLRGAVLDGLHRVPADATRSRSGRCAWIAGAKLLGLDTGVGR